MPTRESAAEAARDQLLLDAIPKKLSQAEAEEAVTAVKKRREEELSQRVSVALPEVRPSGRGSVVPVGASPSLDPDQIPPGPRSDSSWTTDQIPPGQPTPAMDPDQIPPGQPTPVVTALSQEADDLRAALVADLLRVEQEALLNEVAETLAYLNLELLSTSEAVTHIVAVVDDFRRRCAQILG